MPLYNRIITGAATVLGRLAQAFRTGIFGATQPPEQPEPARERLRTLEQVQEAVSASRLNPPASEGSVLSWKYACYWIDVETGDRVEGSGGVHLVQTGLDTDYRTAAAAARRSASALPEGSRYGQPESNRPIKLKCVRVGDPIRIDPLGA